MKKKVCLFDFDGTLIDSMGGFAAIAGEIIDREHGVGVARAREMYYSTSGLPFFQQLDALFPGDQRNPTLADEYEQRKLDGFFAQEFFADVKATLDSLRAAGIKVAVSSNNFQHNIDKFVVSRAVKFDYVLGFREGFAKGREHFEYVIKAEKVDYSDFVFVGDSIKDGEKARSFGVDFIARTGTFTAQDFRRVFPEAPVIDNISELLPILLKE